jgi:hypothetical protein
MPVDIDGMKKRFAAAGNRFTFFLAVEYYKPQICQGIAKGLKNISSERFRGMVNRGEFFTIPPEILDQLSPWKKHVQYVKPQLVGEIFAGARPDLYQILEEMGTAGGVWIICLHKYLKELILGTPDVVVEQPAKKDMVLLECWKCHQKWPVERNQASTVDKCPFCGASADQYQPPAPAPDTHLN